MNIAEESRKRRNDDAFQTARNGSISPPPKRHAFNVNGRPGVEEGQTLSVVNAAVPSSSSLHDGNNHSKSAKEVTETQSRTLVPSPVQLNFVEQLPASSNVDCISLGNILGDPMIKECWLFNYLFDMDFVMRHFDQDTRDLVQIRVVHGSWKREDPNGMLIEDASKRYPNIKVVKAYVPDMFGTHHTKAIVLFRHDNLAQVVILTANFIERDFRMSQAIWRTPLLPLQKDAASPSKLKPPFGSGRRFKLDLLAYFRAYSRNGTTPLVDLVSQLQDYDFRAVRGALIASVPGIQMPGQFESYKPDRWGLVALTHILDSIPTNPTPSSDPNPDPHIVAQVSSISSVGEKWFFRTLIPTLSRIKPPDEDITPEGPDPKPKISIIFPTATSIRHSIGGYTSGSSIHMKTTSPTQAKQLAALKPMLCHWSGPTDHATHREGIRQVGRSRAAPHIKTYMRFSDSSMNSVDWAIVTSANLSTQAWASNMNVRGMMKICSYELGVVVWPALWDCPDQGPGSARMVPVFGADTPTEIDQVGVGEPREKGITVGWRMPYDLPLIPYGADDKPWCAAEPCNEPDSMGRVWPGYPH